MAIELAASVRQVVVTGYRHCRRRLVVGRDNVAACRVLLLGVDAEGVEAELVRLRTGTIEDEHGVDAVGADRQLRRRPPADIATGIGPDQVQPWRMHLGRSLAHLAQGIRAVELVETVEERVFGFQERPPHGDWRGPGSGTQHVVDNRAMGRAAEAEGDRCFAFDGNLLLGLFQRLPFAIDHHLVGVGRVGALGDQVDVVILEHGQAPAEVAVVAEQGERVERLEVAIQVEARRRQLGLVPHRRHRKTDVRVAGQQRPAAAGAAAGHGPGVAALELRDARIAQRVMAEAGEGLQALPVGSS